MNHKTPTYFRKGKTVRHVEGAVETFPSISKAKRHSRQLQQSNGRMGDGFLRVEA